MFLKLKNISFNYKQFQIIKNLNFSFEKIGLYKITGASGSGKTTLLKIIGGFLKSNSGEIIFKNKNIFLEKDFLQNYRQNIIGFSYQNLHLIDELSLKDNLELKAKLSSLKIDYSWQKYLLEYFEIEKLLEKKVSEISGGQALKVSIVKSMMLKPKILLLDEPESWLDSRLTEKLQILLKDYSKKNLVIISSHYLNEGKNDILEIKKI